VPDERTGLVLGVVEFFELQRLLLEEMRGFGRLHATAGRTTEDPELASSVSAYTRWRKMPMHIVLFAAEEVGAGVPGMPVPYRLHRSLGQWPRAGYADEGTRPIPMSAVQLGCFDYWDAAAQSRMSVSGELRYCLVAAMWVAREHGVEAALQYVLDLVWHGHVLNAGAALDVLFFLLIARSQTSSDEELAERVAPATSLADTDVDASSLRTDWITGGTLSPPMTALLLPLLERAISWLDDVRGARNLDEWLPSIHVLGVTVGLVRRLFGRVAPRLATGLSLGVQAILGKLEEIVADAGALPMGCRIEGSFTSALRFERGLAEHLEALARSPVGRRRFMRERLLIPEHLLDRDKALPASWTAPSWRLAMRPGGTGREGWQTPSPHAGPAAWELSRWSANLLAQVSMDGLPEEAVEAVRELFFALDDPEAWGRYAARLRASGAELLASRAGTIGERMTTRTSPSIS
jgi:hypothetical protein